MILLEDKTILVTILVIIGMVVGIVVVPHVQRVVGETWCPVTSFEGKPSVGSPGEDGMPYGWYCYPKTEHNLRINERCWKWAVNQRGICEWR